jgi:hypothetical protein
MSKHPPDMSARRAWMPEAAAVVSRPSWMARAMSTRPPAPSLPPPTTVSVPPSMVPPSGLEAEPTELIFPMAMPPPAAVDIATSTALAALSDENAGLRAQVAEMAATMAGLRRQVLEASEGELVKLAVAIAERVILRELQTDPSILVGMARDAIETLAAKDEVVIAVARDVPQRLPATAWDAVGVEYMVQVDPQLAPGGIEVRTPQGIVAATPEARLGAVAQALDAVNR